MVLDCVIAFHSKKIHYSEPKKLLVLTRFTISSVGYDLIVTVIISEFFSYLPSGSDAGQ